VTHVKHKTPSYARRDFFSSVTRLSVACLIIVVDLFPQNLVGDITPHNDNFFVYKRLIHL